MNPEYTFSAWFHIATGHAPYPFQTRFACDPDLPQLVDVPTGLGKTAMAMLGWLWRRRFADEEIRKATPQRLVYCLPMRVLVEQTVECARKWIKNLKEAGKLTDEIPVHVLMGGEEEEDWDVRPESDRVIVGTQDMLISRGLNRGYAATRSRWPIQFGMLNTSCLWVFDEIQLMGSGLATTTQLEAFRRLLPDEKGDQLKNGHGCSSVWMSATLQRDWLKTVDFKQFLNVIAELRFSFEQEIETPGLDTQARQGLEDRWHATKPLEKAKAVMGDATEIAKEVLDAHRPGTRTIVILNTVKRAHEVFDALSKVVGKASPKPAIVLLHSRFRPEDRRQQMQGALAPIQTTQSGTIVVSTQVIEAGVDVSATTLFTEVAPWAALVQRFGRCNRYGMDNTHAKVCWIGLPAKEAGAKSVAAPYELAALKNAEKQLAELHDAGLQSLPNVQLDFEHTHVIRRKDLIDLFDTTPDLAGNDIDIDRFVRDVEDSDVQIFWREYGKTPNETDEKKAKLAPRREELCSAPIGSDKNPGFRQFAKRHTGKVWRWNFLDNKWEKADADKVAPGQVFLLHADAGGYLEERGWEPGSRKRVEPIDLSGEAEACPQDASEEESFSKIAIWQTIAEHTDELCKEIDGLSKALSLNQHEAEALRHAARWHDRGKAHAVFQAALPDGAPIAAQLWAKAPEQGWRRYERRHFRHELASALAVLDPQNTLIPEKLRNLVAYLVASHHGKVRLSIRSLPNERRPNGNCRFARGIWDDDELPETDLGDDVIAPAIRLSLEPMELGLCEEEPFAGQPSWAERMLGLRDRLGPFHLAYLEALLRAADWRVSANAMRDQAEPGQEEEGHSRETR